MDSQGNNTQESNDTELSLNSLPSFVELMKKTKEELVQMILDLCLHLNKIQAYLLAYRNTMRNHFN